MNTAASIKGIMTKRLIRLKQIVFLLDWVVSVACATTAVIHCMAGQSDWALWGLVGGTYARLRP